MLLGREGYLKDSWTVVIESCFVPNETVSFAGILFEQRASSCELFEEFLCISAKNWFQSWYGINCADTFWPRKTKPRLFFKSMLFEFLSTFITIENLVSCFQLWTLRTKKLTCWKRQSTTSPFSILFSYRFLNRCTIIARCQTRQLFPVYHLQFNIYPREACLYKSLIKVRLEEGRIQTYAIFITTWTQPQTITRSFSTTVWSAKFQRKETFRCDGAHVVC